MRHETGDRAANDDVSACASRPNPGEIFRFPVSGLLSPVSGLPGS